VQKSFEFGKLFVLRLTFLHKSINNKLDLISEPSSYVRIFGDKEDGRQGMIGNGHTSRVWKGDGNESKKPILQTLDRLFKFGVMSSLPAGRPGAFSRNILKRRTPNERCCWTLLDEK
jgi:hypothetical protein